MLLAHFEVLAEVLVTAPPVQVDHAETLVAPDLMEVRVPNVVLDAIGWESSVAVESTVSLVRLTNPVTPVVNHPLLLVLDHSVEKEAAPEMEDDHAPEESHAVLPMEWLCFPVDIAQGVLEEASNVFERSPSLGIVTRLFSVVDKFEKVAISILGQGSSDHISALIDVRHAIHKALDTSETLTHDRFGVVSVVEVLSHLSKTSNDYLYYIDR